MSDKLKWWRAWAPYWEHLEDRHLGVLVTETFVDRIAGPVLVIGSGQGIVVERLAKQGLDVIGVDREPAMAAFAKRRRNIRTVLADARHLPFERGAFRTVIIATGIVDYIFDETINRQIIAEAHRVTQRGGDLIIAFYRLTPRVAAINRRLGVLTPDGKYRLERIFDIMRSYQDFLLAPLGPIRKWTGKSYLRALGEWFYLGMTLPASMKAEQQLFTRLFESVRQDGLDEADLLASVPEAVPYRDDQQIQQLVRQAGIRQFAFDVHPDCAVVRHHKFADLDPPDAAVALEAAADGPPDWIIRTDRLTKRYSNSAAPAVDHLSISIARGTVFGLLGPNGAGKTTTLSMMCGLVAPSSGTVAFKNGSGEKKSNRPIGYVPQELALYERLTARDNLAFFGKLYNLSGKALSTRIDALLDLTGLSNRASEPVSGFSQGMKRRLNLAVGLLHEPDLVLMDEPTVGIDPQSRNRIHDAIFALRERGTTILYTTHYMEEATKLCDHIAIMDRGSVILYDEPGRAVRTLGRYQMTFACRPTPPRSLLKALTDMGAVERVEIDEGGERLRVTADTSRENAETIAAIIETARDRGQSLSLTKVVEPNLESLFLDITGRSLRDTAG